jgi:hypothetical protein
MCDTVALNDAYEGWQPPSEAPSQADVVAPAMHRVSGDDRLGAWVQQIAHLSLLVDRLWVPDLVGYAITQGRRSLSNAAHFPIMSDFRRNDPLSISAHAPLDSWFGGMSQAVHEPLDPWSSASHGWDHVKRSPHEILVEAATTMESLAPLIECGAICIYPVESLYMRHVATQLFGEARSFSRNELLDPELYVAECLAMARSLRASYAALSQRELQSLERLKGTEVIRPSATEERVVVSFAYSHLPLLDHLTAKLATKIREDESAFDDFRVMLRGFVQQIPVSPADPRFERELDGLMKNVVTPQLEKLSHAIGTRLWRHTRGATISFCAGAFAAMVTTSDPTKALGTASVSALASILGKILFERDDLRPAHRVVLALT